MCQVVPFALTTLDTESMTDEQQNDDQRSTQKLSGAKLFAIRLLICFLIVGGVYFACFFIFAFETHQWWLFAILLPFGWVGALIISTWIVGAIFYDRDE